jgi:hypothetical protein
VVAGTVDNRGRLANTLSTTNGGTLKIFREKLFLNTGTVNTGRLFDGGEDSSGQVCNQAPNIPSPLSPLDGDVPVKQPSGDVFLRFVWSESTDPEGGAVTYDIQIARDALFNDIEKFTTGITGTETQQTISIVGLPLTRYWRVRALDPQGQDSDWSNGIAMRLVLDDGINHGGGDCNISAGAVPGTVIPALFGAALMAFGFFRRRR